MDPATRKNRNDVAPGKGHRQDTLPSTCPSSRLPGDGDSSCLTPPPVAGGGDSLAVTDFPEFQPSAPLGTKNCPPTATGSPRGKALGGW